MKSECVADLYSHRRWEYPLHVLRRQIPQSQHHGDGRGCRKLHCGTRNLPIRKFRQKARQGQENARARTRGRNPASYARCVHYEWSSGLPSHSRHSLLSSRVAPKTNGHLQSSTASKSELIIVHFTVSNCSRCIYHLF